MKLRMRLALTTMAVALPIALGLAWVHRAVESHAHETVLAEYALTHMLDDGRERCEASPETWSNEAVIPMDDRGPQHHGSPPHHGGPHPPWGPRNRPPPPPPWEAEGH
ncbi:MAG: hypothetical protein ACXU86_01855, partial [Archangium sp.]